MEINRMWDLAGQASALLPSAPASGDAVSWLDWNELVWATASRLGEIGGIELADAGLPVMTNPCLNVVTAEQLLCLGLLLRAKAGAVLDGEPRQRQVHSPY